MSETVDRAKAQVRQAARDAAPWVERLARTGYFARGVVYITVGIIAGRVAFGSGGRPAAARGAMFEILRQPFGRVLLGLLAAGLLAFAVWRFVQAVLDPERLGSKFKGLRKRTVYFGTAIVYVGLAASAVALAMGHRQRGDQTSAGQYTAPAMRLLPFGRWIVLAVGVGIAGYGLWRLVRAFGKDPIRKLDLSGKSMRTRQVFLFLGRFGLAARGAVFLVIGIFLARAGWHARPGESIMAAGALEKLREQPFGPWLLGAVAAGLGAYGIIDVVKARYRRIRPAR